MKPQKQYSLDQIKSTIIAKGYKWFETGNFNLNLIGIRNSTGVTNTFDDTFFIAYKDADKWKTHQYACTTDPGDDYLENPLSKQGTAILVPGQYRSTWRIDKHQGLYDALKQFKAVPVYRDSNKDHVYNHNPDSVTDGIYGINIHRASATGISVKVDKWSAGCQVLADRADFANLMYLARVSARLYSNSFTYTLIEAKDIKSF